MIKVLSSQQIKALDAYTIQNEPVASIDLMERACRAFTVWFTEKFNGLNKTGIVCGTGNNGGDGLGVARMLKECEYPVKVWIVRGGVPETEDFKANYVRLKALKVEIVELTQAPDKDAFSDRDILIDGIFGSGLSRSPEGLYAAAIDAINTTNAIRVAIDIPSGLMADKHSGGSIVRAHFTASFQLPKLVFFFPQYHGYIGHWILLDIGLSKAGIADQTSSHLYISRKAVAKILKQRDAFDHKGTFGHAMLIAGSYGKMGACILASRAALRSGAGLLSVHTPGCGYDILQTNVPEAMVTTDKDPSLVTEAPSFDKIDCLGIGPGLGQEARTVVALQMAFETFRKPVVIDADALNILAANRHILKMIPAGSILTPHPKEFERLVGKWKDDFERLEKLKELAATLSSVVILKGAFTAIATPDGVVYFNSTGNPGMATGGTGDVLTGILTGILAQKYSSLESSILGVYVHGLAGDLGVREKGEVSLIASDLIDSLPTAFQQVTH